jgi:hypothetical protein
MRYSNLFKYQLLIFIIFYFLNLDRYIAVIFQDNLNFFIHHSLFNSFILIDFQRLNLPISY